MSPKLASYPELKSKAAGRPWKRAIHPSSSSAYRELPDSSLDPPDPMMGKLSPLPQPLFGVLSPLVLLLPLFGVLSPMLIPLVLLLPSVPWAAGLPGEASLSVPVQAGRWRVFRRSAVSYWTSFSAFVS